MDKTDPIHGRQCLEQVTLLPAISSPLNRENDAINNKPYHQRGEGLVTYWVAIISFNLKRPYKVGSDILSSWQVKLTEA